jgi:S-adenosylmethionine:tRNA ribosyltransferase-isomerase
VYTCGKPYFLCEKAVNSSENQGNMYLWAMKPSIKLPIEDFDYHLPDQSIAYTPAGNRSDSKLLVWNKEIIAESTYNHIAHFIPEKAALYFNNSKVIAARIHFQKANETRIEIFCLEPSNKYQPISMAMQATQKVEWICLVGGAKKWKEDYLEKEFELIQPSNNEKNKIAPNNINDNNNDNNNNNIGITIKVRAKKIKSIDGKFLIEFSWDNENISFSEIIEHIGSIPLPPYIQRATTEEDKDRYQTTYAKQEGSVAAPTAGLHFNTAIFESLAQKKCSTEFISLHVGAGTFMPVKTAHITDHEIHAEDFEITYHESLAGTNYVSFKGFFEAFRASKNKKQECIVTIKIGLNRNNKIVFYKEEKIETIKRNNIQKSISWCEKFKIPYNKFVEKTNIFLPVLK